MSDRAAAPRYHHVVLFRFHDGASGEVRTKAVELLRALGAEPGVLDWRVEESLDTRKGHTVAELGTFESEAAFQAWRGSETHRVAAAFLGEISDWLVVDFQD